jgi:hypothetical protein
MGKTTDGLLALVKQVTDNPDPREVDMLLATGEQVSISILTMVLHEMGRKAISMKGHMAGLISQNQATHLFDGCVIDMSAKHAVTGPSNDHLPAGRCPRLEPACGSAAASLLLVYVSLIGSSQGRCPGSRTRRATSLRAAPRGRAVPIAASRSRST